MADITNPVAIKFVNEEIRPLCEQIRALCAKITNSRTSWFGGINNSFPNDSSPVVDGREGEGVSRLTGADINSVMGIAIAMLDASNAEIIEKPTVRPLEVI